MNTRDDDRTCVDAVHPRITKMRQYQPSPDRSNKSRSCCGVIESSGRKSPTSSMASVSSKESKLSNSSKSSKGSFFSNHFKDSKFSLFGKGSKDNNSNGNGIPAQVNQVPTTDDNKSINFVNSLGDKRLSNNGTTKHQKSASLP